MTDKLTHLVLFNSVNRSAVAIWDGFFWPRIPDYCRKYNRDKMKNILLEQSRHHFSAVSLGHIVTMIKIRRPTQMFENRVYYPLGTHRW